MSYRDQLVGEINSQLDTLAKMKQPWRARWIAHGVCNAHANGLNEGDDADFWRYSSYEFTRKLVTECINRRAGPKAERSADDGQFAFPEFERTHLQNYYVVKRDGEELGIFVGDLTDDEIEGKAALYRSQAATCYEHADELDRFKAWRKSRHAGQHAESAA